MWAGPERARASNEVALVEEWPADPSGARPFVPLVAAAARTGPRWRGVSIDGSAGRGRAAAQAITEGADVVTFQPWVDRSAPAGASDVGRSAAALHRADHLLQRRPHLRWRELAARVGASPTLRRPLAPVMARLARAAAELAAAPVTPVHGDLRPDNVVVSPSGPVLIDLEFHRRDIRIIDLGALALPGRTEAGGIRAERPRDFLAAALVAYEAAVAEPLSEHEPRPAPRCCPGPRRDVGRPTWLTPPMPMRHWLSSNNFILEGDAAWAAALDQTMRDQRRRHPDEHRLRPGCPQAHAARQATRTTMTSEHDGLHVSTSSSDIPSCCST